MCVCVCLSECICACLDLDSKACRDELSHCLKSLYSSCFLLSEIDWIIQGFHFDRAEVFIAAGLCRRHLDANNEVYESTTTNQPNLRWRRSRRQRDSRKAETWNMRWSFSLDGTLRPETLTLYSNYSPWKYYFILKMKKTGSLWPEKWSWGILNNRLHKVEVSGVLLIVSRWGWQWC